MSVQAFSVDTTAPNYNDNLKVNAVTGRVLYAPLSVEAPGEDITAALSDGWVDLGWIDGGVSVGFKLELDEWKAFNKRGSRHVSVKETEETFKFTLASYTSILEALYFNMDDESIQWDDDKKTASFTKGGADEKVRHGRFIIDLLHGDMHERYFLPYAYVSDRGEIKNSPEERRTVEIGLTTTVDPKLGYSLKKFVRNGWKPGTAGAAAEAAAAADYGDHHEDYAG